MFGTREFVPSNPRWIWNGRLIVNTAERQGSCCDDRKAHWCIYEDECPHNYDVRITGPQYNDLTHFAMRYFTIVSNKEDSDNLTTLNDCWLFGRVGAADRQFRAVDAFTEDCALFTCLMR